MRSFDLGRQFSLVTIPFRPFQHLTTVEDQMACLSTIHRHLGPGGRLILDLFNPSIPLLAAPERWRSSATSRSSACPMAVACGAAQNRRAATTSARCSSTELIYYVTHPDGRTERLVHAFPMRYLFRFEAEHLLVRCGYTVEALYAGYDRSAYGSTYPGELILSQPRRRCNLGAAPRRQLRVPEPA